MIQRAVQITLAVLILVHPVSKAVAQGSIDPSSALLLNSSPSIQRNESKSGVAISEGDSRLDSGRYTVRPRSERTAAPPKKPIEKTSDKVGDKSRDKIIEKSVVLTPDSDGVVTVPSATEDRALTEPAAKGTVTENAPGAALNQRVLELTVATGYFYESAESGYSLRNGHMAGPSYSVGAKVWLSPEFGIGGNYFSSLGGQVADGVSAVSAARTEAVLGLYIRSMFSNADLSFGAEYSQSEFKLAGETTSRLGTKTKGLRLSVEALFAKTPRNLTEVQSEWVLGFSAAPKVHHEETPAATNVRSGAAVNSYQVGASLERRWRFDSSNMIFLKLEHRVERDLFTGAASQPDPIGGATPNGVSATVGTTVIQFGYGWGG